MSSGVAERPRPLLGSAVALAIVCFVAFNANGREIPSYDSQGTRLLAIELARRHTFSLGHVVGRTPALGERPAFMLDLHGNYRSTYPLPSSLAAAAVAWVLSAVHAIDLDAPLSAALVAKLTASALSAIAVALAFVTASRRSTRTAAAVIAVAFGLGTNIWAGASQTLWQQETALSALMLAILLLSARTGSLSRAVFAGAAQPGRMGTARWHLQSPSGPVDAGRWGRPAFAGWLPLARSPRCDGHQRAVVRSPARAFAARSLHPGVHGVAGSLARAMDVGRRSALQPEPWTVHFSPVVIFSSGAWARRDRRAGHPPWAGPRPVQRSRLTP